MQLPLHPPSSVSQDQNLLRAWREQLARAAQRPDLNQQLFQRESELLPYFASYYTKLQRMPRRARRSLQRWFKQSLAGFAVLLALGATAPAMGVPFFDDLFSDSDDSWDEVVCNLELEPPPSFCPARPIQRARRSVLPQPVPGAPPAEPTPPTNSPLQRAPRRVGPPPPPATDSPIQRVRAPVVPQPVPGAPPEEGPRRERAPVTPINVAPEVPTRGRIPATPIPTGTQRAPASPISVRGDCTLEEAITCANTDTAVGGCTAGNGVDTIVLPERSHVPVTTVSINHPQFGPTGLPVITSPIVIDGNGSTIARALDALRDFRIFAVGPRGDLALAETAITGGAATRIPGAPYSDDGGGLLTFGGNVILIDSTVSGNTADDEGGGIYSRNSSLAVANSTISSNSAASQGGGVSGYGGELDMERTLISGNTAPSGREAYVDAASGIVVTVDQFNLFGHNGNAGVEGFSLGSTDVLPPQRLRAIIDPETGEPMPDSPALDAITVGACASDADGAICDIGSSESLVAPESPAEPPTPSPEEEPPPEQEPPPPADGGPQSPAEEPSPDEEPTPPDEEPLPAEEEPPPSDEESPPAQEETPPADEESPPAQEETPPTDEESPLAQDEPPVAEEESAPPTPESEPDQP